MNDAKGIVLSPTEVRFQRLLPGPIETIWAFLTDSRKRGEWLASGPMDLRIGGKVKLRFKHADLSPHQSPPPENLREMDAKGHESEGEITELDAPRRLAFTWGSSSEVLFELEPRGNEVLLTLTHRRLDELGGVTRGWHSHLAVLVERANGRVPPAFWDLFRAVGEKYDQG